MKSCFFINPSFRLVETDFQLITNLVFLFRAFSLVVNANLEIKCWPIFKGNRYSSSLKPISWIFSDTEWRVSSFFRLLETKFSSNASLRLMCTDFGLILNYAHLFRAFFPLLMESISEFRCKPILFQFLKVDAVFPVSENRFFIECFIPASGNGFAV